MAYLHHPLWCLKCAYCSMCIPPLECAYTPPEMALSTNQRNHVLRLAWSLGSMTSRRSPPVTALVIRGDPVVAMRPGMRGARFYFHTWA